MKKIERLKPKGKRTMFSASVANELIDKLNMLLGLREGTGIKLTFSDAGPVIELSDAIQKSLALKGNGAGDDSLDDGQGPGPLRWRGEWDQVIADAGGYDRNDIVIHRSASAIDAGNKAGTYISVIDAPSAEPSEDVSTAQVQWRTFAKGSWSQLRIGSSSPAGSIYLDSDACNGLVLSVREIDVCDEGVPRKMLVIGSEVYD